MSPKIIVLLSISLLTASLSSSPTFAENIDSTNQSSVTADSKAAPIQQLKITILSTMLTDVKGIGEWGFSAVIESNGKKFLYDTGDRPDTVLNNAKELGIDLSQIEDVILSHNHWDHVTGLVTLRKELSKKNPKALSRAHVATGIFLERILPPNLGLGHGSFSMTMAQVKSGYEATGGKFIEYSKPTQLIPGIWLTGPVPRPFPEKNYPPNIKVRLSTGEEVVDYIPEDQSLIFDTPKGLVVLSGCGHAGIINILTYAKQIVRPDAKISAVLGGLHFLLLKQDGLTWTSDKLKEFGVKQILGAHCTGLEPIYFFRNSLGLNPKDCLVGEVNSTFDLDKGIDAGVLANPKS